MSIAPKKGVLLKVYHKKTIILSNPLLTSDLIHNGIYLFAMPTKVKIKDREKSDWLTKSLVLLQILWFMMQCIAWAIEHLLVMHLKIITLAYAAINFVIYIFWWIKPLNINQHVQVLQILDPSATVGIDPQGLGVSGPSETLPQVNELFSEVQKFTWKVIIGGLLMIYKFIASVQDNDVNLSCEDRVLRIRANNTDNDATNAVLILLGVGVCFGAIHCTAWLFSFPTHIELLIWQISSVCITAVPIYILLMLFLAKWLSNRYNSATTVGYLTPLFGDMVVYCGSGGHFGFSVLAFTSLRELPPRAYETVHWTAFIPHV